MKIIDKELLDSVSEQARMSQRLRMNYNLHDSLDAKAQRLLNALEPGSVIPIHRHSHTAETYFVIRGKIKVMVFDDNRSEINSVILTPLTGNYGIHILKGMWHTIDVLEEGTVIFEVKDGPYCSLEECDILI